MSDSIPEPKPTTGDVTARTVNAAWAVTRNRLERDRRERDPMRRIERRLEALERQLESLISTVSMLAAFIGRTDDPA